MPPAAQKLHLPGRTSPGWNRCTRATILLALLSCYRSPWGRPWIGSCGWGLQDPQLTSFSLYFFPMYPLHPFPLLRPRFGAVRSGRLHSQPGIRRVRAASLHMPGRPSCAGRPCGSLHSILGTCSSGDVCACWLVHTVRCSLSLSISLLLLLPAQIKRSAQCSSAHGTAAGIFANPVILLFVPPDREKDEMRR